jgi:hypothetical protein
LSSGMKTYTRKVTTRSTRREVIVYKLYSSIFSYKTVH